MISLRDKLKMVGTSGSAKKPDPESQPEMEPLYMTEARIPVCMLEGIEQVTLSEIRECEPNFTGSSWALEELLFLDTETTGLAGGAGTVAFEIGVGFFEKNSFRLRQYAIRDYTQEGEMLGEILKLVKEHPTIITFNGKTFDLPLIESRCIMNGLRISFADYPQLDLLHICRRVFKLRLGRCNLAALEQAILGSEREDDLPGAQVPQRFFDYLRLRDFSLIQDVLRHNFDDVLSMPKLVSRVASAFRDPEKLEHPEDIYGVGRTLMRGGHINEARQCYRILGHTTMSGHARMRLAESYKKERDWKETIEVCTRMIEESQNGIWPYVELAKYYEHVERDYCIAEKYSVQALNVMLNSLPLMSESQRESGQQEINRIYTRINRIRKKAERQKQNGIF